MKTPAFNSREITDYCQLHSVVREFLQDLSGQARPEIEEVLMKILIMDDQFIAILVPGTYHKVQNIFRTCYQIRPRQDFSNFIAISIFVIFYHDGEEGISWLKTQNHRLLKLGPCSSLVTRLK